MRYRDFGRTGMKVSEVGFGAWGIGGDYGHIEKKDALDALAKAEELGCNFVDTATVILGTKSVAQAAVNLGEVPGWVLSEQVLAEVLAAQAFLGLRTTEGRNARRGTKEEEAMSSANLLGTLAALVLTAGLCSAQEGGLPGSAELPEGTGLAAKYPGDLGIEADAAVVFVEDFEQKTLGEVLKRWNDVSNKGGEVLAFSDSVPPNSAGKQSLGMTATRGRDTGGHLFKVISPGHEKLHVRFYTKFAADHGFCHHFVRIRGMIDPVPYPLGQISKEPSPRWCGTDVEPVRASEFKRPPKPVPPPGIWALSSYWPEMRSWRGPGGTSFYPDLFEPQQLVPAPRGEWVCVEVMVKMNSSPAKSDGEQALWIDGKLVAHLGPSTVRGYWRRDKFILDDEEGKPFEGFRWRKDMRLRWNRLWLLYYVTERAFKQADAYASQNPDPTTNARTAAVWFDHIVVAGEYVGPIKMRKE